MMVSVEARATSPALVAHDAACIAISATGALGPFAANHASSAGARSAFTSTGAAMAAADSDTAATQREIVVRIKRGDSSQENS